MHELKRACLTLLTFQAWLETNPPLPERNALKAPLDDVLFWYSESLSKRWMRNAGVEQLRDWQSAWGARTQQYTHGLQQDLSLLVDMMPLLTAMVRDPRAHGLRHPRACTSLQALLDATESYRRTAFAAATAASVDTSMFIADGLTPPLDELRVYFTRVASATR